MTTVPGILKPAEEPTDRDAASSMSDLKAKVRLFDLSKEDDVTAYEEVINKVFRNEALLRWEQHYDVPGKLLVSWANVEAAPDKASYTKPEVQINPDTGEPYVTQPHWPRGLPDDYPPPPNGVATDDFYDFLASQGREELLGED